MRKILTILLLVCLLTGCGEGTRHQLTKNVDNGSINVDVTNYQDKIIEYDIYLISNLKNAELKSLTAQDIEEYTDNLLDSIKYKGVKVTSEYQENKKRVIYHFSVNVNDLNKINYEKFGLNKNLSAKKLLVNLKKDDFTNKKV